MTPIRSVYRAAEKLGVSLPLEGTASTLARRKPRKTPAALPPVEMPLAPSPSVAPEDGPLPQDERTILLGYEAKDLIDDLIRSDVSDDITMAALSRIIDLLAEALDPELAPLR